MDNEYQYDCSICTERCDGVSKGNYNFKNDIELSEYYEKELIRRIKEEGFDAKKTENHNFPDIEVYARKNGTIHCYVEVKVQRRSFMKVKEILPQSDLIPSETLALNLSDLERYFKISKEIKKTIYIMWVLLERPCILKKQKAKSFYQDLAVLKEIYDYYRGKRRFKRKSGVGDIVEGQHKGVVVNYHFSINELEMFSIPKLFMKEV